MKRPPGLATARTRLVDILAVSPIPEDHFALACMVPTIQQFPRNIVQHELSLAAAFSALKTQSVRVVICESELQPGTWRDMLDYLRLMPNPPLLIVTARLADERLWAEALNLGAYDVLVKPFDAEEVVRILALALQHRREPGLPYSAPNQQRTAIGA